VARKLVILIKDTFRVHLEAASGGFLPMFALREFT
jgi:hypothetical protein